MANGPLDFVPGAPSLLSLGSQQQPLISLGQQQEQPEVPSKFRDFALNLGARPGSLLFAVSGAFGQGTEEIAARKRRELETRLFEKEAQARLTAKPQRQIIEDVGGRKRFVDDKSLVFPDAQAPVKPLTNVQEISPGVFAGINPETNQLEQVKSGFTGETSKQLEFKNKADKLKFEQTTKLVETAKKDKRIDDFIGVTTQFDRINSAIDTAAGDISLIFSFMKINDPGSTVREGEFATAQNSGSIPDNVRAQYNKALTGERLTPERRADFKVQAQSIFDKSKQTAEKALRPIEKRAEKRNLNAETIREQIFGVEPVAVPPALVQRAGAEGEKATDNATGQEFVFKDGQWQPL